MVVKVSSFRDQNYFKYMLNVGFCAFRYIIHFLSDIWRLYNSDCQPVVNMTKEYSIIFGLCVAKDVGPQARSKGRNQDYPTEEGIRVSNNSVKMHFFEVAATCMSF